MPFAYQQHIRVNYDITVMLQCLQNHPALSKKLLAMQLHPDAASWIMDGHNTYGNVSEVVISKTGAPQGIVLSPFRFSHLRQPVLVPFKRLR